MPKRAAKRVETRGRTRKTVPDLPMEACLIVVGLMRGAGPDRFIVQSRVEADTGYDFPVPALTMEEMQPVAHAAKMAVAKVLTARLRAQRAGAAKRSRTR